MKSIKHLKRIFKRKLLLILSYVILKAINIFFNILNA